MEISSSGIGITNSRAIETVKIDLNYDKKNFGHRITCYNKQEIRFIVDSPKYGEHEVIIDAEDFDKIKKYRWVLSTNRNKIAAINTRCGNKTIYIHCLIMSDILIDHKNMNVLDNRKCNLRKCTKMQNAQNSGVRINNISGYKGVSWSKEKHKWRAYINLSYKQYFLGYFKEKVDAALAYNAAVKKFHGEFARPNII